jgi:hypothetical protein
MAATQHLGEPVPFCLAQVDAIPYIHRAAPRAATAVWCLRPYTDQNVLIRDNVQPPHCLR